MWADMHEPTLGQSVCFQPTFHRQFDRSGKGICDPLLSLGNAHGGSYDVGHLHTQSVSFPFHGNLFLSSTSDHASPERH
jgi:hypothetical protein